MPNLPGDYIAGFVDGEECFYLTYRSEKKYDRKGQPTYYRDDIDILKQINKTLNCGKITVPTSSVRYNVQNMDDINDKIIPNYFTCVNK